ncbi:MAG: hypothetical protein H6702_03585 [Myxococcales bacterium]|nr:hypothetical protein [Myxococcales bacterium]
MRNGMGLALAAACLVAGAAQATLPDKVHGTGELEIIQRVSSTDKIVGFGYAHSATEVLWYFCGAKSVAGDAVQKCEDKFTAGQETTLKKGTFGSTSFADWKTKVYGGTTLPSASVAKGGCILDAKKLDPSSSSNAPNTPPWQSRDFLDWFDVTANIPGSQQPDYGYVMLRQPDGTNRTDRGYVLRLGKGSGVQYEYWMLSDKYQPFDGNNADLRLRGIYSAVPAGGTHANLQEDLRVLARRTVADHNPGVTKLILYQLQPYSAPGNSYSTNCGARLGD